MFHRSHGLGLLAVLALIPAFLSVPHAQAINVPSTTGAGYSIGTKIIVKDLTPDGRVISRHVYRQPTVYLTDNSRGATLNSHTEADGPANGTSSGRRTVTITSSMRDSFGVRLWHQWVTLDFSWNYPQSVRINSQSRGWHPDDSTVGWQGWQSGSSKPYAWAGALYPYSGYYKSAQGGWSVICLALKATCYYYPWTKLWVHSNGTFHYYFDWWSGPFAKVSVVRR